MIDHIGFAVSNYERAKSFYAKALAPLGYTLIVKVPAETNPSGHPAAGFGTGASRISGSAAKASWRSLCTLRSSPRIAPVSMPSIAPRSQPASRTTADPDYARSTIRITTARSCSMPTGTISKPSATRGRKTLSMLYGFQPGGGPCRSMVSTISRCLRSSRFM